MAYTEEELIQLADKVNRINAGVALEIGKNMPSDIYTDDLIEKNRVINKLEENYSSYPTITKGVEESFPVPDIKVEKAKNIIRGTKSIMKNPTIPEADKQFILSRAQEEANYELQYGDETISQRFERERKTPPYQVKSFKDPNYLKKTLPESIIKTVTNLAMFPEDLKNQIQPILEKKDAVTAGYEIGKVAVEQLNGMIELVGKGVGAKSDEYGFPRFDIETFVKNYRENPGEALMGLSILLGLGKKISNSASGKTLTAGELADARAQFADFYNRHYSTFSGREKSIKALPRTIDITSTETVGEAVANIYNPASILKSERGSFSTKKLEEKSKTINSKTEPTDLPTIGKPLVESGAKPGQSLQIQVNSNSKPFTADFIENHGEFSVFSVQGIKGPTNIMLPNTSVSVLKQTGEHDRSPLSDIPISKETIEKGRDSLFLLPNNSYKTFNRMKDENIGFLDVVDMKDDKYIENIYKIEEQIDSIKKQYTGFRKQVQNEWNLTNPTYDNIIKQLNTNAHAIVFRKAGLDIGDVIETSDRSGNKIFLRVTDVELGAPEEAGTTTIRPEKRYKYDKGYKPTSDKPDTYAKYTVKRTDGPVEPKRFKDLVIPRTFGSTDRVPLHRQAPKTYAYMMNALHDLQSYVDNIKKENSKPLPEYIFKQTDPEIVTRPEFIDVLGENKGVGKSKERYITNIKAKVKDIYGYNDEGNALYNTDQGILDAKGIEYFPKGSKVERATVVLKNYNNLGGGKKSEFLKKQFTFYNEPGIKNEIDAIKYGKKTSMILPEKQVGELKVGQVIAINGSDEIKVQITGIDHHLETKLGIKKIDGYDEATNKDLAIDVSRTEGMSDVIYPKSGKPFSKPGSSAVGLFYKGKKNPILYDTARIVFKYLGEVKKPRIGKESPTKIEPKSYNEPPYEEPLNKEDQAVYDFITQFRDAILSGDKVGASKLVKEAISNDIIAEPYAKDLARKFMDDKLSDPANMTLIEHFINMGIKEHVSEKGRFTEAPRGTTGLSEEAAAGMGQLPSFGGKATRHPDVKTFEGIEHVGGSYTRLYPIYDSFTEVMFTGSNLPAIIRDHYIAKRRAFQEGRIKPDTREAQLAYFDHPALYEEFGKGIQKNVPTKELEEIVDKVLPNETKEERIVKQRDIDDESRIEEQIINEITDEQREEASQAILKAGSLFDKLLEEEGSFTLPSDLISLAQKIKRKFSNKINKDIKDGKISPEVQKYNDFTSELRIQLPIIFKDAKAHKIPIRDYLINRYVKSGFPQTGSPDNKFSAELCADTFMELYITPHVQYVLTEAYKNDLYKSSLERKNPSNLKRTTKESLENISDNTKEFLYRQLQKAKDSVEALRFFPAASPELRVMIERYYGQKKDLQLLRQRNEITILNNIPHSDAKLLMRMLALRDELARAKSFKGTRDALVKLFKEVPREETIEVYNEDGTTSVEKKTVIDRQRIPVEKEAKKYDITGKEIKEIRNEGNELVEESFLFENKRLFGKNRLSFDDTFVTRDMKKIFEDIRNLEAEFKEHLRKTSKNGEEQVIRLNNIKDAISKWDDLAEEAFTSLVTNRLVDPGRRREDYLPYLVATYGDLHTQFDNITGVISKAKKPSQGYLKRAHGSSKERVLKPSILADYATMVESDIQDINFLYEAAETFDINGYIPDKERRQWGLDENQELRRWPKNGEIIITNADIPDRIKSKSGIYKAYTPEWNNMIILNDAGRTVIDGYRRTYILAIENIHALENMVAPYDPFMNIVNKATALFKTQAIYSVFLPFQFNNMFGDSTISLIEHPERLKLLKEVDNAFSFMVKNEAKKHGKEVQMDGHELQLEEFVNKHKTMEAGTSGSDISQFSLKNVMMKPFNKARDLSNLREAVLRVANASYLVKKFNNGEGAEIKELFGWLPINKDLDNYTFAGEASKDFHINYNRQSPQYRRYITNALIPFGHFPIHATNHFWRWHFKGKNGWQRFAHAGKAGFALLALPTLFNLFNNGIFNALAGDKDGAEKKQEQEALLSPGMRNRIHLNVGEKTWFPQYVLDMLVGAKAYSVLGNALTQLITGEMTPDEFIKSKNNIFKQWIDSEWRGVVFGLNPIVRITNGLWTGVDPVDKTLTLPLNRKDMSDTELYSHIALYMSKCLLPIWGGYSGQYYDKSVSKIDAIKNVLKRFGGPDNIFGIREREIYPHVLVEKNKILGYPIKKNVYGEVKKDTEEFEQIQKSMFDKLGQSFRTGDKSAEEWIQSEETIKQITDIYLLQPDLNEDVEESIKTRIKNIMKDIGNNINVLENKRLHAKTDEEKKIYKLAIEELRVEDEKERIKKKTITGRAYLNKALEKSISE